MKTHNAIVKDLYAFLRGELSEQEVKAIESHLASCSRCADELKSLKQTTDLMSGMVRPSERRPEMYWQQFATRLERRIEQDQTQEDESRSFVSKLLETLTEHRKPFGIGFASALTLMMIVFGVWSVWLKTPASGPFDPQTVARPGANTTDFQNVSLDARVGDYLEQSRVLLIGLMNADTKSPEGSQPQFVRKREISRLLVRESEDLTSRLNDPSQRRLKELVSDLQMILIQIANLEANHNTPGVEIVKGGIQHKDILFKINLEEIQRTTRLTPTGESGESVKPTI